MNIDGKQEALRATGGAALLSAYGLTLNDWLLIISIAYFALQCIILLPKAIRVVHVFGRWVRGL